MGSRPVLSLCCIATVVAFVLALSRCTWFADNTPPNADEQDDLTEMLAPCRHLADHAYGLSDSGLGRHAEESALVVITGPDLHALERCVVRVVERQHVEGESNAAIDGGSVTVEVVTERDPLDHGWDGPLDVVERADADADARALSATVRAVMESRRYVAVGFVRNTTLGNVSTRVTDLTNLVSG